MSCWIESLQTCVTSLFWSEISPGGSETFTNNLAFEKQLSGALALFLFVSRLHVTFHQTPSASAEQKSWFWITDNIQTAVSSWFSTPTPNQLMKMVSESTPTSHYLNHFQWTSSWMHYPVIPPPSLMLWWWILLLSWPMWSATCFISACLKETDFLGASDLIFDACKLTNNYCVWRHNLPRGFQVLWEQHVLCFCSFSSAPLITIFFPPNWTGLMRHLYQGIVHPRLCGLPLVFSRCSCTQRSDP